MLDEHYRKLNVGKIDIRLNYLATRIIFTLGISKVIGIEFLDRPYLYKADPKNRDRPSRLGIAFIRKEIIVSSRTYNTPQLLILSRVSDP